MIGHFLFDRRISWSLRALSCCVGVAILTVSADGWAQVTGSNGDQGSRGEDGVNGGDGSPGTPGGDGIRESLVTNGRNVFSAIGGRGGDGGDGHGPAGNGGNGGTGGDARATAITSNAPAIFGDTSIEALGGYGGHSGQPASWDSSTAGGTGGDAGRADAFADVVGANVTASATGGDGGDGSGIGSQGGAGGDSRAEVLGRSLTNDPISVRATSTGGNGGTTTWGSLLGNGGFAQSLAWGRGDGAGSVTVNATAEGGSGGYWRSSRDGVGGDGGSADAQAYGESSDGGRVSAGVDVRGGDAWRGNGGSIRLVDVVDGKTAGWLELYQVSTGGESHSGIGGDAESRLSRRDEDGGTVHVNTVARGGLGGTRGGDAIAAAEGFGHGDVYVEASATAGSARTADGSAGSARLDRVYGESLGGGLVSVTASLSGGAGAAVASDSRLASPDHPLDVIADGIVNGTTSGRLELAQWVHAASAIGPALGNGPIVRAGSALNRLERRVSASHLTVRLETTGGQGVSVDDGIPAPSDGGNASTIARIVNETGGVYFSQSTRGGPAGIGASGARGGDASLDVEVETHGDGSDIEISPSRRLQGGDSYLYNTSAGGIAGNATGRLVARALGNSMVEVFGHAEGGDGRTGGSASSFASGANAGSQRVFVRSRAESGSSRRWDDEVIDRGVARSEAHGFSPKGTVEVEARALTYSGGYGPFLASDLWTGGQAMATASADGRSSHVRADSIGISGAVGEQVVVTRASARGDGNGLINLHTATGVDGTLAVPESGVGVSVAIGGIHSRPGEWGRGEIDIRADRASTDIVLGGDFAFVHDAQENPSSALFVSFLAIDLDDDDFASLAVRITEDDQQLLNRSFDDAASARAFFAEPLSIGALIAGLPADFRTPPEFVISIEGTGISQGTDFHLALAVGRHVVPEPGVLPLMLLGLLILGSQKARG